MEIKGKVHCMFEQSGVFKTEFKKLGYDAYCYDIQNNFNETDYVVDLFKAIEDAYDGKPSLFDDITKDDLIIAFFPCIYFCEKSQCAMTFECINYRKLSKREKIGKVIERENSRHHFYTLILKLFGIMYERGLRMIVENPASSLHFLQLPENFIVKPTFVDKDRTRRGDFFRKPTAYWFVNCDASIGYSYQQTPKEKQKTIAHVKSGAQAGLCSEERSMISPDYARNFICDFIIGKEQQNTQLELFKD